MHVPGGKIGSPSEVYYTGWKKMDNKERGQREAQCQNEVESIKGEVVRLRSA
jgi:hypothetical protein